MMQSILAPVTRAKNEQEKRLELISGGVIDFWSLDNPDAGRGRKYALVVIDEAAMIPGLEEAWQQSIRPTLTDHIRAEEIESARLDLTEAAFHPGILGTVRQLGVQRVPSCR
jgi:hypothetical protein